MPQLFDVYSWKARVQPAIIVAGPAALAALVWLPKDSISLPAAGMVFVWAALGTLISQLVRDFGARKQVKLFREWGGAPTTRLLQHSVAGEEAGFERRRQQLSDLTGIKLPSAAAEQQDPSAAESTYRAAVAQLRERTRDHQVLFQENCNYGFRRNLWALKPVALSVVLISTSSTILALWHLPMAPMPWFALGIDGTLLLVWLFIVKRTWVRRAAEGYAVQLFAAAECLDLTSRS